MGKSIIKYPETGFEWIEIFKKVIITFVFGIMSLSSFSNYPLASKQQIAMFKNSKTFVVFEDGISFYNEYIRDAVRKYWKSTNYEFIDQKEFEKWRIDSKYSFIVLAEAAYDKDQGGVRYIYINLLLGDVSGKLTQMPEYCSLPIFYSGENSADYEYVIPAIVKFMQIHVKNLEKDRLPIAINGLEYYNRSGYEDKVLLLNKDKMASETDSPEKIKTVFPFNVKLLTLVEINKELAEKMADEVFHFHLGPPKNVKNGKCFDMLFDPDGNLYYFNSRKISNDNPDGFNIKDFRNIR